MKVKEDSEKAGLKLNILKMKILVSSPITSWQVDGETTETVTDFIFLGSKILQMVTAAMKLKDTSSVLAWRIPGTGEPGGLPSMESHRVGHDWSDLAAAAPWKKSYDQSRQHIKKQRHYFANKGTSFKAMVFPVAMYGCESWTIKKAEHRQIDAFEL